MREPTLKKVLEPYLKGIDSDLYYDPTGNKVSALFLAVLYATSQSTFSPTESDRQYAKRVVELLLEYGADPMRHEGNNPQYATPLSAAKTLSEAGRDPEGVYELLLKHSINSATEGAAFENKFTDGAKKVGKAILSIPKGVGWLGKKGLELANKGIGGLSSKLAEAVYKKEDRKRIKEADKYRSEHPEEFGKGIEGLPDDQAKETIIFGNLKADKSLVLSSNQETDEKIKKKLAEKLVKVENPMSSSLLDIFKKVSAHLASPPEDTKIWSILMNDKYKGMLDKLTTFKGLSSDPNVFADQISFIAYYVSNSKNLDLLKLKDKSGWKSLRAMKMLHSQKKTAVNEMSGKNIILKSLRKTGPGLTKADGLKFIAMNVFGGNQSQAQKFMESAGDKIGSLLNKKYEKTFEGDSLVEKLVTDMKTLLDKMNSGGNSQSDKPLTGREIILSSIGSEKSELSKSEGIEYIAKNLFSDDKKKAEEFFENNRAEVTKLLNKKYEKTFEEDSLQDMFIGDLRGLVQATPSQGGNARSQLNEEQEQASLALQSLGYSKSESIAMVKGKEGDSAKIVYDALKSAGNRGGK